MGVTARVGAPEAQERELPASGITRPRPDAQALAPASVPRRRAARRGPLVHRRGPSAGSLADPKHPLEPEDLEAKGPEARPGQE